MASSMGAGFRPILGDPDEPFDFTLAFELGFLSLLPSAVFFVVVIARLYALRTEYPAIGGSLLQTTKLIVLVIYALLQLALVALWSRSEQTENHLGTIGAALAFVDAVLFCSLSWLEHARSLQPSAVLIMYFSLSFLFDLLQIRTLWLQGFGALFKSIATVSSVVKAVIVLLESVEKRRFLRFEDEEHSPEDWSGFWSLAFYVWVNPLLLKGYKQTISIDDLYPLKQGLPSKPLAEGFNDGDASHICPGRFGLGLTLLRSLGWEVMYPALPRLLLIGFVFGQPLLIDAILNYLQTANSSRWPQGTDNFLIAGLVLIYLGIAICNSFYSYLQQRVLVKMRAMLVSAIYRKVTEIPSSSTEQVAITLMSADVQRLTGGFSFLHDVWAELLEVAIAIWLLQRELGVAAVGPFVVAMVCFFATMGVNRLTMPRQGRWMKALEKRVNTTVSLLSSMKGIRMTGLGARSASSVQSLREAEIESANGFRTIMASTFCIAFTPGFLTPVACFGIYLGVARWSGTDQSFDVRRAFTSLSLVVLLTQPLSRLFQYVPMFLGAANCLERIQTFLRTPAYIDPRHIADTSGHLSMPPSFSITRPASDEESPASLPETEDIMGADEFVISNGEFGWDPDLTVLKDVNINIPRSRLTMIAGPVASGKTTLCKALAGEVPYTSGTVYVDSSGTGIGFCDQAPYLTNATVRDNITGYSPLDETWYQTVVQAVALPSDFETFPKRDQTMIGSNGTAISTGQRQRVAIARAVYARKPVIILDDVFSGMDAITKKLIFRQLLGPDGLLRNSKTTVIMVAHDKQFLNAADLVITLKQGESPTSGPPGAWLLIQLADEENPENSKTEETKPVSIETDQPKAVTGDDARLQNISDWSVYRYYAEAVNSRNVLLMMLFGAAIGFLYTFPSIWVKWWTSDTERHDGFYMSVYAILQVLGLLFWFLFARHCLTTSIATSGTTLHKRLLSTVMSASMSYFSKKDSGVIVNKFSQDMQLIDGELPAALLNTVATAFISLSQAVVITTASPWIALCYPFLLLAFYGIQRFYLRTSQQLRPLDLELKSPLYTHFLDTVRGISTIRALGWSTQHIEHNYQLLDTSQRPQYLLAMVQQWLSLVLSITVLGAALILAVLALKLQSSIGFTAVALVNLMSFSQMLKSVVFGWTMMETSISAVARVKEFAEQTPREEEGVEGRRRVVASSWPRFGKIECRGLAASYGPSAQSMALKDMNLEIKAGEKMGICGRSGSGKSSFLASLFRMLDIREGSITIDKIDIQTLSLTTLRSRINAIPQDPFFLPGTIRENADPYQTASEANVAKALKRVHLWDKIQENGGLDSELKADSLSQGQKQLFSLARAMLRPRCSIVVLDEVTSSLDFETEKLMLEVLQEAFKGCTIIAIAHRLESILDFDRVAVFEDGRVIECDAPKALAETQDSVFTKLLAAGTV